MVQAEVQKRTKCPNCGAKLPEQPLSLCSYCAMPLDLADGDAQRESKNTARIQKIRGHKDFEAAEALDPPEAFEWQVGWRAGYQGRVLMIVGAISTLGALPLYGGLVNFQGIVGLLLIAFGVFRTLQGKKMQAEAVRLPLLKRPALITDRRSDTTIRGWGGHTRYYFTIEFEDGGIGEFAMQGKGVNEEPYTTNLPGMAYTRGETLLHFKHIRV